MIVSMAIYLGIFGGMAEEWQATHGACLKEMSMFWWIVATLLWGLLFALLLHKFGISTVKSGAIAGAWIGFLIMLIFGISNASTYTAYPSSWLPYDVIGSTVSTTIAGGVVGWIYGKVK
ncbi:MAG: hypothetical protein D6698_10930 [Gammaproteobacteria bacterium]|nr:MAG: hypothetical protein D6698_10930 [Gammaproteobacteria bacterium]